MFASVFFCVYHSVGVCLCLCVCVCVCMCVCDTFIYGYGSQHDVYDAMKGFCPCNVYVYFFCGLVCTCIHESDAELTCMCFSQAF